MILTHLSRNQLFDQLNRLHLSAERALVTYAGFASSSKFAGQARQTFSLVLNERDIKYLHETMQTLYQTICEDLTDRPPDGTIPFDFIRIDAYYDTSEKKLQILEINSRDAGMHEICEWLDNKVLQVVDGTTPFLLNDRIAINQKAWHEAHLGPIDKVIYMSRAAIPRWLYYDALDRHYPQLADLNSWSHVDYDDGGITYLGETYKAVITKAANFTPATVQAMDKQGTVSIVQTRLNGHLGEKKYLESLDLDFVANSKPVDLKDHDVYISQQADLVLKLNKSSGSRGVVVGRGMAGTEWENQLNIVYENAEDWTIQSYANPGDGLCIPHGKAIQDTRVQLGIFVLPKPDNPTDIDIDIVVKGYVGNEEAVMFDPAGRKADIWFGNVIVTDS